MLTHSHLTVCRRWIRLLFGREFPLDAVFDMWDALFAIDSSLEIVDMISLAMLLRIRWDLVAADTNEAFTLLLRYPEPAEPAYTFIKDALYLRDHLTPQGGAEIISRYGKQPPSIELEPSPIIREPSPSPSFASSRTRRSLGSPRSFVGQHGVGIEALLQGAAKNVLERGSQWGVGKAIREAVGEVKKNVEFYQSSATTSGQNTPRAGAREFRKPAQISTVVGTARPDLARTTSGNVIRKIENLERRNRNLAKMLEAAVGELWEYHRERNDEQAAKTDDNKGKEALEALSLAIAKVQFVQVYLEDSSIPLPEEATELAASATVVETLALPPTPSSAPPISIDPPPASTSKPTTTRSPQRSPARSPGPSPPPPPRSTLSPRSRPHLTSSNFSWMLGEDSASSNFATGAAHSAFPSDEKRRMKGRGFLFGDDDDGEERRGSVGGKAKASKKHGGGDGGDGVEEEVIDLDNMGGRGVV